MSVDFAKYCDDPAKYAGLPKQERDYWNNVCSLTNGLNILDKNFWKNFGKEWKKLGKFGLKILNNMVNGIFSPMGLEYLSIFMGVNLTGKAALFALRSFLQNAAEKGIAEAAAEIAAKDGIEDISGVLIDVVVANQITAMVVEETAKLSTEIAVVDFIGEATDDVLIVQMIVQFLGMIMDTWDPCGFDQMLTGSMLKQMSDIFNGEFETQVLSSISSTKGVFGKPVVMATWPIEYYADTLLPKENGAYDDKYWVNRRLFHIFNYIYSLKVNSNGIPIYWPPGGTPDSSNPDYWVDAKTSISYVISDDNAVVGQWISKWWIVLVLLAIVFVVFILLLK